jgi:hypothetical protein
MNRKLRVAVAGALTVLVGAAYAGHASGDGLPLPLDASQTGVTTPDGSVRYQSVATEDQTVVMRTDGDGVIDRSSFLDGMLTIPAVAYDGTSSGLSANGETLVLIRPRTRFPRAETTFAVLDTRRLHLRDTFTLAGDFSFDAISPDGRTMYLIEYADRRDPTQYHVRSYDLERGVLSPQPIVDPSESAEEMYGSPVSRAMSPDGRWAYTLYDGNEHPFIHALDTERGEAVCIDLEMLHRIVYGDGGTALQPSPDGSTLTVVAPRGPTAIVDTETFEVSEPPAEEPPVDSGTDDSGGAPWLAIGLGALAAVALLAVAVRRRQRSRAVGSDDLERLVRVDEQPEVSERERERDPVR